MKGLLSYDVAIEFAGRRCTCRNRTTLFDYLVSRPNEVDSMPTMTDDMALVKDILDRVLASGDLEPLLDSLADDVVLAIATPDGPERHEGTGRTAVVDYFEALRELFAFWRVTYASRNRRVLVLIDERFTLEPSGLVAQSEFALLFDLRDGRVTRLLVVEDPSPADDAEDWQEVGEGDG